MIHKLSICFAFLFDLIASAYFNLFFPLEKMIVQGKVTGQNA